MTPFSRRIEILPASQDQMPILANLLQLYIHDFTEFVDLDTEPDGRFSYPHLPCYWSEPDRHPFLVKLKGKLAGFVLVKKESGSPPFWDMAEFFILRKYRRQGIGTRVAQEVWGLFPGQWQVRVMSSNTPGNHFWSRAVSGFTGEPVHPACNEKNGASWHVFSFQSKPKP
jgi:predicted acetyltransferase